MSSAARRTCLFAAVFLVLILAHLPFLRLPYFWDEAGYYVPAALDFYRHALLIPHNTVPSGHPPLLMIYLALVWRVAGFSEVVTRVAMLAIAAAAVLATYTLGNKVAGSETGAWSALLVAISPLFFAQSSLVFLDLGAALFTVLAVMSLLQDRPVSLALAGIAAVMTKETAVVMLPPMCGFLLFRRRERRLTRWAALATPLIALGAWAFYYHQHTGFWVGNPQYLQYNVYSAVQPLHVVRSFTARAYEVLVQGFNWILALGAVAGIWFRRRAGNDERAQSLISRRSAKSMNFYRGTGTLAGAAIMTPDLPGEAKAAATQGSSIWRDYTMLAIYLIVAYVLMLSVVGGAVLSRYMLPVEPLFVILAVGLVQPLPKLFRESVGAAAAACFVLAWFVNPPYPFPYENNLSYADFIALHQEAAKYLQSLPGDPAILTAWPATDELRQPALGYVRRPLNVVEVENFTTQAFQAPLRFQLLYIYSRKWQPKHNLLEMASPRIREFVQRIYDYRRPVRIADLVERDHLKLLRVYERRGQWVRIFEQCQERSTQFICAATDTSRASERRQWMNLAESCYPRVLRGLSKQALIFRKFR
jgi:4-amino-4-deoxy-L-arabinose transferase-like glycosyltransferase